MNRAKMRKLTRQAIALGAGVDDETAKRRDIPGAPGMTYSTAAEVREQLLEGAPAHLRPTLRARIQRAAALTVLVLFVQGCGGPRVVYRAPLAKPMPGNFVVTNEVVKLLEVSADGAKWTWYAEPEEVMLVVLDHVNKMGVQFESFKAQIEEMSKAKAPKKAAKAGSK